MWKWNVWTSPWNSLHDEDARHQHQALQLSLSWWKSSAHLFKNFEMLAVKYLAIPATSAPSERIWSQAARVLTVRQNRMSEEVTSEIMNCKEKWSFCTSTIWGLQRGGCIMTTITLLKNIRLYCLHFKIKRMVIQKLMLGQMWTKSGEEQGDIFRVLYYVVT